MSLAEAAFCKVTVLQPASLVKNNTDSENLLRIFYDSLGNFSLQHLQTAVSEGRSFALFSFEHLKSKTNFPSHIEVFVHTLCKNLIEILK